MFRNTLPAHGLATHSYIVRSSSIVSSIIEVSVVKVYFFSRFYVATRMYGNNDTYFGSGVDSGNRIFCM